MTGSIHILKNKLQAQKIPPEISLDGGKACEGEVTTTMKKPDPIISSPASRCNRADVSALRGVVPLSDVGDVQHQVLQRFGYVGVLVLVNVAVTLGFVAVAAHHGSFKLGAAGVEQERWVSVNLTHEVVVHGVESG